MGTTIVGCMFVGDNIYVGHVGDSRCYRVSQDGIEQLTRDHSLLEDYKEAKPDMTEEEARNFPHKNVITRALGMRETVVVDISKHRSKTATSSSCAPTACPAWSTTRPSVASSARPAASSAPSPSSSSGQPQRRHRQRHRDAATV